MTDIPETDRLRTVSGDHRPADAQSATRFDAEAFQAFSDLLGKAQALFWLNDFCNGLQDIASYPVAPAQTPLPSRAILHHLCGRAGMMGFTGLHEACHAILEADSGQAASDAACQRLRAEARLALQDAARQRALLA